MKLLVETTGQFQLICNDQRQLIRFKGCTLVVNSAFVESRCIAGQLRLIAQVSDEATDGEWRQFEKECEGDQELAVAAFVSKFPLEKTKPEPVLGPEPEPEPISEPKAPFKPQVTAPLKKR